MYMKKVPPVVRLIFFNPFGQGKAGYSSNLNVPFVFKISNAQESVEEISC